MTQPTDDIDNICGALVEINFPDADKNTENDNEEHNKVARDMVDADDMLFTDYINLLMIICMYFNLKIF